MEITENLNEKSPKIYEIGYLLSPLVAEANVADTVNSTLRGPIEQFGGQITTETLPIMRPLAYEVKKAVGGKISRFTDAYFGAIRFSAKPQAIATINEALDQAENIIRFMTIIAPKDNPPPRVPRRAPVKEESPKVATVEKSPMTTEDIDKEIEGMLAKV